MAAPIYIPTNSVGGSLFSTPSPVFTVCRPFDDSHSDQCEMIHHCGNHAIWIQQKWSLLTAHHIAASGNRILNVCPTDWRMGQPCVCFPVKGYCQSNADVLNCHLLNRLTGASVSGTSHFPCVWDPQGSSPFTLLLRMTLLHPYPCLTIPRFPLAASSSTSRQK